MSNESRSQRSVKTQVVIATETFDLKARIDVEGDRTAIGWEDLKLDLADALLPGSLDRHIDQLPAPSLTAVFGKD